MKIIVAQGNPGLQYARTRHNIGFMVVDALAVAHNAAWKKSRATLAETAEIQLHGQRVLLVKPLSFYNETGTVAQALLHYHKQQAATDLLVVHDELALPFGTIRTRQKGSDAGNNGIKSLIQHVGSDFWRIRIGIWNEHRDRIDDADFVLSAFSETERNELENIKQKAIELIDSFIKGDLKASTH